MKNGTQNHGNRCVPCSWRGGRFQCWEYTSDMKFFLDGPRRKYPELMQSTVKKARTSMSSSYLQGMEEAYNSFKGLLQWIIKCMAAKSASQTVSVCPLCFIKTVYVNFALKGWWVINSQWPSHGRPSMGTCGVVTRTPVVGQKTMSARK